MEPWQMEQNLLRLVGSGFTLLAAEHGTPPPGSIERGEALVEQLVAWGGHDVAAAVVEATRCFWRDWCRSGLPPPLAERHIVRLPEVLERYRPAGGMLADAIGAMTEAGSERDAAAAMKGLAARIVASADQAGDLERLGLSPPISFFLIERLLAAVLEQRLLLIPLGGVIVRYFLGLGRASAPAVAA
jgi:hypothetical protein